MQLGILYVLFFNNQQSYLACHIYGHSSRYIQFFASLQLLLFCVLMLLTHVHIMLTL